MSWISRFLKDIRSLDKSAFSITTGFRAAAFATALIIAGFLDLDHLSISSNSAPLHILRAARIVKPKEAFVQAMISK
jgi:hypothetical protein